MRIRSVASKYLLTSLLTLMGVTLAIIAGQTTVAVDGYARHEQQLQAKLDRMADVHATQLAGPLWNLELATIQQILETLAFDEEVRVAAVYEDRGQAPLAMVGGFLDGERIDVVAERPAAPRGGGLRLRSLLYPGEQGRVRRAAEHDAFDRQMLAVRPIVIETDFGTQTLGYLALGMTRVPGYQAVTDRYIETLGLLGVLMIALAVSGLAATAWIVQRPLRRFVETFREASNRGRYPRLEWSARDELGQLAAVYNAMRDGIEQLELERNALDETVREQRARLNQYLQHIPAAVAMTDDEQRLLLANELFREWFGDGVPLQTGRPLELQLSSSASGLVREMRQRSLTEPVSLESKVLLADGAERLVLAMQFPITDPDGQPLGHGMIIRDETELRQAHALLEEAARQSRLGDMTTMIAHELNQPLNIILLATNNLGRRIRDGVASGDFMLAKLDRIQRQTERAAAIVSQMQRLGQVTAGRQVSVDPLASVRAILGLAGEQLRSRDIEVVVELPERCPPVSGDPVELERALLALVTNARQALERDGERRLEVRVEPEATEVVISVADSGPGIPEGLIARIFDPFFTTRGVGEGVGLGLSMARTVAKEFGGSIEAANRPEGGAIFRLHLPIADPGTAA